MDRRNRKGDRNKKKSRKTLKNVQRHSFSGQEADQQEELSAEPGLESKGTKDHLKRFEQKLNLILGRISNGEEDLGQRISTVEENLNELITRVVEHNEKLEGTLDHLKGKLHIQDIMISDLKEALQDKNETNQSAGG